MRLKSRLQVKETRAKWNKAGKQPGSDRRLKNLVGQKWKPQTPEPTELGGFLGFPLGPATGDGGGLLCLFHIAPPPCTAVPTPAPYLVIALALSHLTRQVRSQQTTRPDHNKQPLKEDNGKDAETSGGRAQSSRCAIGQPSRTGRSDAHCPVAGPGWYKDGSRSYTALLRHQGYIWIGSRRDGRLVACVAALRRRGEVQELGQRRTENSGKRV